MVRTEGADPGCDPGSVVERIARAFTAGTHVGLISPRTLSEAFTPPQLASWTADVVRLAAGHFDGLIATGGDTARRIVDALDVSALDVAGEVEPGVPFGVLRSPSRDIPFATKAGGFGSVAALSRCLDRQLV